MTLKDKSNIILISFACIWFIIGIWTNGWSFLNYIIPEYIKEHPIKIMTTTFLSIIILLSWYLHLYGDKK